MSPEKLDHAVAGALFSFMAWLTTRDERLMLSARDDSAPAADAVVEFMKLKRMDPNVHPDISWEYRCSMIPTEPQNVLEEIAEVVGGKIESVSGPLPDGSGFAVMSMPLPKDHWLTQPGENLTPGPLFIKLRDEALLRAPLLAVSLSTKEVIRAAARYAIRCATANGTIQDFDPDAMVQGFERAMIGYTNTCEPIKKDDTVTSHGIPGGA